MLNKFFKSLAVVSVLINPLVAGDHVYVNWDNSEDYTWKESKNQSSKDTFVHKDSLSGDISHKLYEVGSGDGGFVLVTSGTVKAKLALAKGGSVGSNCKLAEAGGDYAEVKEVGSCVSVPIKLELMQDNMISDDVIQTFYVDVKAKVEQAQSAGYFGAGASKFETKIRLRHVVSEVRSNIKDYYVRLSVRGGEIESEDSKPEYSYDGNGNDEEENYELFKK
ncbi:MAG: hypothetical protein KC646_01250 [Candidatus Cloacimonetes bacterium]|nr:hypothetical protein [Candidatus Cloacimonadota bacterium]